MNGRVQRVQELRRSNAAGAHGRGRPEVDEEPCVCGSGFTCLAALHDDDLDDLDISSSGTSGVY